MEFRPLRPTAARALVVFHDSGWAITPLSSGAGALEVRLLPWARIEGTALNGGTPLALDGICPRSVAVTPQQMTSTVACR